MDERQKGYEAWRIQLLRSLAIIVVMVCCTEVALFFFGKGRSMIQTDARTYSVKYVLTPTLVNLVSVWVGYRLLRSKRIHERWKNDIPLYCIAVFGFVVSVVHIRFAITAAALIVPVLVSVVYGNKKMTKRITLVCLALAALALVLPVYDSDVPWTEAKLNQGMTLLFIISAYFVGRAMLFGINQKNEELKKSAAERSRLTENLKRDAMTGLFNHVEFYRCLGETIAAAENSIGVAVIDIDDFKRVNDTFGHENGNEVLIELSELLIQICPMEHISRYGGEEFTIIFVSSTMSQMKTQMEKFLRALQGSRLSRQKIKIGVSIGLAMYEEGQTPQQLFEKADAAMYQAKKSGKNRICAV